MTKDISAKVAKTFIDDPLSFKLVIAKRFLNMIPNKLPQKKSELLHLEANIDAFVFFSASVIDVIKRQINDEFELFDKDNVFYIHGIRKKLADSGNQKKIKQIIANYFTIPALIRKNGRTILDATQSSLWRLQVLRNQAAHGHIIKMNGKEIIFVYTVHEYKNHNKKPYALKEPTRNPRKYLDVIFDDLCEFATKIHRNLC
jgi:hypothetical protein